MVGWGERQKVNDSGTGLFTSVRTHYREDRKPRCSVKERARVYVLCRSPLTQMENNKNEMKH